MIIVYILKFCKFYCSPSGITPAYVALVINRGGFLPVHQDVAILFANQTIHVSEQRI